MAVIVFSVFVLSIILFSYVRRTLLSINNKNNSLLIVAGSGIVFVFFSVINSSATLHCFVR